MSDKNGPKDVDSSLVPTVKRETFEVKPSGWSEDDLKSVETLVIARIDNRGWAFTMLLSTKAHGVARPSLTRRRCAWLGGN